MDSGLEFEWDPEKAQANFRKHGITFEKAIAVFFDPLMVSFEDDRFAYGEVRELAVGSVDAAIVAVVYVERLENVIRIISARPATPQERRYYAND